MNLLLDTNIFLEVLLGQEQAESAAAILCNDGAHNLFMTDFSFHSIGVLLFRRGSLDIFTAFADDLGAAEIQILRLEPQDASVLAEAAARYNLDFDDSYQYEIARRFHLTLISYDSDFDRTDIPHGTPQQIIMQ